MSIKAVLFDFDGVVADTMRDNCSAWTKAFALFGFKDFTASEFFPLEGMGTSEISQYFIRKYSLDPSIRQKVIDAKERIYKEENKFKIYDFVEDIFIFLRSKAIKIAIVTGASRVRIENNLTPEFMNMVDVFVTADDVVKTKPDPEPYLTGMKKLGHNSEECCVVENAILGIKSAKAAGCYCYAVETTLDSSFLRQADEIFTSHDQLLIRLKSIIS